MGIVLDMKFFTRGAAVDELGDNMTFPDISVSFGLVTCCIIVCVGSETFCYYCVCCCVVCCYYGGNRMQFMVEAMGSQEQIETTSNDSVVYTTADSLSSSYNLREDGVSRMVIWSLFLTDVVRSMMTAACSFARSWYMYL